MFRSLPVQLLCALSALAISVSIWRAPVVRHAAPLDGLSAEAAARVMFDRSEYALERSWRAAAARDGDAAARWAGRSLGHAPVNAYATLALAWAETLRGRDDDARAALERSYAFAPRSIPLAASRVALAQRWWPGMNLAERQRTMAEARVARGLDPQSYNQYASETPRLEAIHRLAEDAGVTVEIAGAPAR